MNYKELVKAVYPEAYAESFYHNGAGVYVVFINDGNGHPVSEESETINAAWQSAFNNLTEKQKQKARESVG